jgi:hypothetical protein
VQGRRITGTEAARLQSIDLDQVDTTMSESLSLDMCGRAFSTMHLHADRKPGQKPIDLYLDHKLQIGDPSKHCFKFSDDLEAFSHYPADCTCELRFGLRPSLGKFL